MNCLRRDRLWQLLFLFLSLSEIVSIQADPAPTDSLKRILKSAIADTSRVNALNELTWQFIQEEKYDSALLYCAESIRLADSTKFESGLSQALINKGKIHSGQENYPEAISCFQSALQLYTSLGDRKNMANSYNLIANAHHFQGEYPDALKNQLLALKIREEIGDETGIAWSHNNIGTIYRLQGDYPAALENFFASLKLLEKSANAKTIALAYNNIANVYSLQGKHTEALEYFYLTLKLRQEAGDRKDILASYINIADAFCDLFEKDSLSKEVRIEMAVNEIRTFRRGHWLDTAIRILSTANVMNEELNNNFYRIFILSGMGRVNYLKKNYSESIRLYSRAYSVANDDNALDQQKEIAKYLADNYDRLNDTGNARKWFMKYVSHKDSLASRLNSDELTRLRMKYEFDKKEAAAKTAQDKKDAITSQEFQKQKRVRTILQAGFVVVLLFAGFFLYQRNNIRKEKNRSENLLLNILPSEVASELKETGTSQTKSYDSVTVMFTDFVGFTRISEQVSPEELVKEIHACFSAFDHILQKHKVEKIKTVGDAYLCAGGLPVPDPDHAVHVVNAAVEIEHFMRERKVQKESRNEVPFQLRIGIHTGPVVAGIVGVKKYAYDIWGDTVNIAARMEQNSLPGRINISSSTFELVKDHFKCTYRGKIEAKNKGETDMYFVERSFSEV